MRNNILILDDEIGICTSLTFALEEQYYVRAVTNPMQGINLIKEESFDVCLLDLRIDKYNGLDVLSEMKKINKDLVIIIMTAYGTIQSSVEAVKKGAYTYLIKPMDISELHLVIKQALEYQQLNAKVEYLSNQLEDKYCYNGIIGKSSLMRNVYKMIEKLKNVYTSVVITGESGTGKELVAKALHYAGSRKLEHFEEINCSAIPEGLLEEEMFGHIKGAFTGAVTNKMGKFEYANGGTIFLDEIGDMPLVLQAKLLRVLQEKEYTPIGSNEKKKIDVRVISATNKDLKKLVEKGDFREDLYFRLNVVEINLPPLRAKRQDLPLLLSYYIQHYNDILGKKVKGFTKEAERKLISYDYPGNIRELSNIIEYSIVLSNDNIIELGDLPIEVKDFDSNQKFQDGLFAENIVGLTLREVEEKLIKASLSMNNGHRNATAKMLGISEKGLRNKIAEYKILI